MLTVGVSGTLAAQEGAEGGEEPAGEASSEGAPELSEEEERELFEVDEDREDGEEAGDGEKLELQRRREKALRDMKIDEAREAGFNFGQREGATTRTTGAFVAITGGFVAHGLGHWYIGDKGTAGVLAAMESGSLALMGGGLASWLLAGDTPGGSAVAAPLFHLGVGTFGLSYLADIVGTIQGGELELPGNSRRLQGIGIDAGYRFQQTSRFPLRHLLNVGVTLDFGAVYGDVRTEQEVSLEGGSYEASLGGRVWRGRRPQTFAYVEAGGDLVDYRGSGPFSRWGVWGVAGVSMDMGMLTPQLAEFVVGAELGWGHQWTRIPPRGGSGEAGVLAQHYLPVDVYGHFNVSERLNVRIGYRREAGDYLMGTRHLGGIGSLGVRYNSAERLDLYLRSDVGAGVSLNGGLRVWLW